MPCSLKEKTRKRETVCAEHLSLAESGPRVEAVVDGPETRFEDVRVDLRRRQIRMAKHHLNRPEVGASFEQVRRKRMADDMRAQRARKTGGRTVTFENLPESHAAQRTAARVDEQTRRRSALRSGCQRGPGVARVTAHGVGGLLA